MRIAFVHDYLTQYGGAERVLDVLYSTYADNPRHVYTSIVAPDELPPHMRDWPITTSPLTRLPFSNKTHRAWLPLYPRIFRNLGQTITDANVVVADSSAWSHHAHPPGNIPFVVYCHSPARFLHGDQQYLDASSIPFPLDRGIRTLFDRLRAQDVEAAQKPDRIIANSAAVEQRIRRVWNRESTVIHPPVLTARFHTSTALEPEPWFLVVSRLVPHKWVDRAIRASNRTGLPLRIIGTGRAEQSLRRIAGSQVAFRGMRPDAEVITDMQRCQALILPGIEDFGMTAVEAQAAGRPVIAACGGGALETVQDGETGLLVPVGDEDALAEAMHAAISRTWNRQAVMSKADQFDVRHFQRRMRSVVDDLAGDS